jgi:hypothetical protein
MTAFRTRRMKAALRAVLSIGSCRRLARPARATSAAAATCPSAKAAQSLPFRFAAAFPSLHRARAMSQRFTKRRRRLRLISFLQAFLERLPEFPDRFVM